MLPRAGGHRTDRLMASRSCGVSARAQHLLAGTLTFTRNPIYLEWKFPASLAGIEPDR